MSEKLQKVLANLGLGSRREIERWIQQGRISVNTEVAKLGDRIEQNAKVFIDGQRIKLSTAPTFKRRILIYNKPEGEVCTRIDPESRPTVFSRLPPLKAGRWIMVGRLDITTQGLLIFTNDGELAHRLAHPSYAIEREYAVRILGEVDSTMLKRLKEGVKLSDGMAAFTHIEEHAGKAANRWFHVLLKEGRNREVRRLWESQGVQVSRLLRIRFGTIYLPTDLRQGQWCELNVNETHKLLALVHSMRQGEHCGSDAKLKSLRRRALTGEAGNASRRKVMVEATARRPEWARAWRTPDESQLISVALGE